ncbi:Ldh family oxidoreductase [Alkalicoccobacillus porphyridii]|nr:Ldh family oxidoreductase [Alkalicoccobacillus porphyridii]
MTSILSKDALEVFIRDIFKGAGLNEEDANIISKHLVLANSRGVESHGVSRVDIYTKRLDIGITKGSSELQVIKETPGSLLIDGDGKIGVVTATKAMRRAVEKAKKNGLAVVAIKNSTHSGMLADYSMYAAKNDCISLNMTNATASMAPWGGKTGYFGTNPMSYGLPAGKENDIIFDMATSVVARGKIALAKKNNQNIPIGWAISKEGKPTSDPHEAYEGLVLPVGGPKGYGLALLVDSLSGLFSGAAYGPHVASLYRDLDKNQNVGNFFLVMRADLFEDLDAYKQRTDQMINEIKNLPLAEGYDRIYLPGEIEHNHMVKAQKEGIHLSDAVLNDLIHAAKKYDIDHTSYHMIVN